MDKLLERFYIKKWDKYPKDFLNRHLFRYSLALKETTQKDKVLDIGCGSGYGTYFLRHGCQYVEGIDIDENAIIYARKNYKLPNLKFNILDFEKFRITRKRENIFDFVVMLESVEHFNNAENIIIKISKILKPAGKLLLTTPEGIDDENLIHDDHKHEFGRKELLDLVDKYFSKAYMIEKPELFGITPFKDRDFIVIKASYPRKDKL